MSANTKRINHRVVVRPAVTEWDRTVNGKTEAVAAFELVGKIKRHIDGCDDISVESDLVCGYCDYPWRPDATGDNGCCDKAVADFDAAHAEGVAR